jgi:hypothetical protein
MSTGTERRINSLVAQAQIRERSSSQRWPGLPTRLLTKDEKDVLSAAMAHDRVRLVTQDDEIFVVAI